LPLSAASRPTPGPGQPDGPTPRTTCGTTLQHFTYAYDSGGNITGITDAAFTGSRTFGYDALSRLTSASGPFGANQAPTSQTYAYDAVGNFTAKAGVVYTYGDPAHPSAVHTARTARRTPTTPTATR
jgi:hypothetical protein